VPLCYLAGARPFDPLSPIPLENEEVKTMLGWAATFLIIALIAAVLGFGGIAAAAAGIAKFLFFLFLVMCVIFFVLGSRGRRTL
jgi:uncharacterized membrane protein YtjA (UPF0391 family)